MWVKMRSIAVGPSFSYDMNQVVNVDDDLGAEWVKAGNAEKVSAPAQPGRQAAGDETASMDEGEKAADVSLINKLRGGNAKVKADAAT
jgi:hypothetical protein